LLSLTYIRATRFGSLEPSSDLYLYLNTDPIFPNYWDPKSFTVLRSIVGIPIVRKNWICVKVKAKRPDDGSIEPKHVARM